MKYIKGQNRDQISIFPISLDASIDQDNEVRIIDLFVESLEIGRLGFRINHIENGRPAYHPKDILKLYIYGYLNRVRSSRELEKECRRNIEVMWLLKGLAPDHNTISNFRRDNPKAIKKVFRSTVDMAKHFDLIGGSLIAGDSTKLRAQNSKKNNFNQKKVERHIEYIEKKLDEHNQQLANADGDKEKQEAQDQIDKHNKRKQEYHQIEKQLKNSGEVQISTSDPESRQMITRNNITEVAYNIQSTVDAKNNIPIDFKITNTNDSKAMGNILQRAKSILRSNDFTALFDKGYHTGSEFKQADDMGVEVMVAIPGIPSSSMAPDHAYNLEHFKYCESTDSYTCPQNQTLSTNGTWHKSKSSPFKQYKTKACKHCPARIFCTKSIRNGKIIQRSLYTKYINQNKERIEKQKDYYRRRQAIVEHPFGTIKRQWGFHYIITKKYKERANADTGFMFIAYNFKRIANIVGANALKEHLEVMGRLLIALSSQILLQLKLYKQSVFLNRKPTVFEYRSLNRLIFGQIFGFPLGF